MLAKALLHRFVVPCSLDAVVSFFRLSVPHVQTRHKYTLSQIHAIDRWKYPTRGGQNLSERYRRLEKSLRGKEARTRVIDESHSKDVHYSLPSKTVKTFRGL